MGRLGGGEGGRKGRGGWGEGREGGRGGEGEGRYQQSSVLRGHHISQVGRTLPHIGHRCMLPRSSLASPLLPW